MNIITIMLFKKVIESDGHKFNTFYAKLVYFNENTQQYEVVSHVNADGTITPITINVALVEKLRKEFEHEDNFPYVLTLDDDTSNDYYITIDRTKDKKPRLDKNGNKHDICIINNYQSKVHVELPRRSFKDFE